MASSHAACVAPVDYEALFRSYRPVIGRVVWRKLGPTARLEDVEDGVSYILGQFFKNKVIDQYRPGTVSSYTSRPVSFEAFILVKVALYCRYLREQLTRHSGHEQLTLDAPAADAKTRAVDYAAPVTDSYPSLENEGIDLLRERLEAHKDVPGRAPVLPLFDAVARRFLAGESIAAKVVRRDFGLDEDGIRIWFGELRDALREVTTHKAPEPFSGVHLPPPAPDDEVAGWFSELRAAASADVPEQSFELGGMTLTAAEVRAAADELAARPGNRVLPAWQDAGHPLAAAGKTWYLGFAEEVMKRHPELRVPPKRHSEGHFGRVKQALIFGLYELAGSQRVPDPEPADVPAEPDPLWADFEAALRRLPGMGGDKAEAALEAVWLLAAT